MDIQKEREAFETLHNENVFKIVVFNECSSWYALHDHLPLTKTNLDALSEMNYGWDVWRAAKAQAIPDGFVLMPKEPTPRMLDASRRRQWDDLSLPFEDMDMLKYKAMIGAAGEIE